MECKIRPALDDDADQISGVVVRALRETNAKDYAQDIIERLERRFNPAAVLEFIAKRTVWVAIIDGRVVGTASLEGKAVRMVFVAPDLQGRGIGKLLMAEIASTARARGIHALTVASSITAEAFYARLGFKSVRDSHYGDERTTVMDWALDHG
jgi:predicted N-acetyltransferase YhbS